MKPARWASHAVVLPGTGSDALFAHDAFSGALADAGTFTEAVTPDTAGLVRGYAAAMTDAFDRHGPIIVGGISIGAAVALSWARRHPERVVGVLAVLPPWLGPPGDAPAALSARYTSTQLGALGLTAVIDAMAASTPPWLAATLRRSWESQWPGLPLALDEASTYSAPDRRELRTVTVPTAVVGATDDPVHPLEVAQAWHTEIPISRLAQVTLDDIGRDPGVLGHRSVDDLTALLS